MHLVLEIERMLCDRARTTEMTILYLKALLCMRTDSYVVGSSVQVWTVENGCTKTVSRDEDVMVCMCGTAFQ